VGEKAQRVSAAFETAKRNAPCVFFIDEIDSLMSERSNAGSGVAETQNNGVVNALLTLMVDLRKSKVILVAATNYMDRLDSAGVREGRFDFKIEITTPDLEARVGLLKKGLQMNVPHIKAAPDVVEMVAQRWNGFSAKRILAVTEELPSYLKRNELRTLGFDEFMGALRSIQGRKGVKLENVKPLSELVFSPNTREMIDMLIGRMADPVHTESHGGTMPTGVLFYGAPGTGKTAAAKAIAKEIDWAFLPTTGSDMARATKALEKLYAQAMEMRPCIIFIDEADELMKDRSNSMSTDATNKLLTLMDGVSDRVRDVVWVAATNHPDQIDAALLRGGRFTEKVVFEKPGAAGLNAHFRSWFERKKVTLDASLHNVDFSAIVGDESIANAEAVAQAALNRAISRREAKVIVTLEDFERAVMAVL
jgi:transitional endoplasmic reticulum ATPase